MPKAIKHSDSTAAKIRTYLRANPTATPKKVAEVCNTTAQHVSVIKYGMKKAGEETTPVPRTPRPVPKKYLTDKPIVNPLIEIPITMEEPASDPVNHPAHYKVGGMETIDFIEAKRLNYNMGNAVKYITRADHKGSRKQDLEKAIWYLKRELDHSV